MVCLCGRTEYPPPHPTHTPWNNLKALILAIKTHIRKFKILPRFQWLSEIFQIYHHWRGRISLSPLVTMRRGLVHFPLCLLNHLCSTKNKSGSQEYVTASASSWMTIIPWPWGLFQRAHLSSYFKRETWSSQHPVELDWLVSGLEWIMVHMLVLN